MPVFDEIWTREQVLALPDDGNRYELVDGELLVSPAPRGLHQRAVWFLYDRIKPYVRTHGLGVTGMAAADLALDGRQVLQPDLFVVPLVHGREPIDWPDFGIPRLAVEVLSPSTARYDRVVKRRKLQRVGVAEYWIVDLDGRVIERWRPEERQPELIDAVMTWQPDLTQPALSIDLATYFCEVWGELTSGD